jgi:hypothetical protein
VADWIDGIYRVSSYIGFAAIGILIAEVIAFGADWLRSRRRGLPSMASLSESVAELRLRISILEALQEMRQLRSEIGTKTGVGQPPAPEVVREANVCAGPQVRDCPVPPGDRRD